jgi:NO-binding membrane sensor protein with MHYT domain
MPTANNFSYGLLTPALGDLMSCLGAFLGLRCASRALASSGASRARWLTLGAFSFGATGIWVMHFIAMLGYTIPGETIRYNVPVTILSVVIAVLAVGSGFHGRIRPRTPRLAPGRRHRRRPAGQRRPGPERQLRS